jgi:hypothetical protein
MFTRNDVCVFRGQGFAVAGQLQTGEGGGVVPIRVVAPVSLPVSGGVARGESGPYAVPGVLQFDGAETIAEATVTKRVGEIRVRATVRGLRMLGGVSAAELSVELGLRCPATGPVESIQQVRYEGLELGGVPYRVVLAGTSGSTTGATESPAWDGASMVIRPLANSSESAAPLSLPGFGTVYLGEWVQAAQWQRFCLLRVAFEGEHIGELTVGEVECAARQNVAVAAATRSLLSALDERGSGGGGGTSYP